MNINSVILAPLITEKSMSEAAKGKFTFKVAEASQKEQIKKAIEEKFKVNVVKVSTINVKGKKKRAGTKRTEITTSSWKKAIVKLKSGQKIGLFEVGGQK